ncbi:MAG TPA: extracellular solute-binding protein [Anaeromyxobacteraceae bacterium]|nr:extracellular solute-binding protein [Anaeromyxobacteraceae bacterium]
MAHVKRAGSRLSRRRFLKVAAGGVLAAGAAAEGAWPVYGRAEPKTLKIMQWSHFVPAFDTWFDGTFCKAWGDAHATQVTVDHINLTEVNARAAAEVAAGKGHDLFLFLSPPAAYEAQTIDHADVYKEVARTWGPPIDLAVRSSYNPRTKRYFAFSDSYTPDPGNYRQDLWAEVGFPKGPDTYDDLFKGAVAIRKKDGNPCGLGLSQELDTNMMLRGLLWSFGGSLQDAEGHVVLDSPATVEAVKYMKRLFQDAETAEVFTWDPSSNNRGILAGRLSYVQNAISVTRTGEKDNPAIAAKILLTPALRGPVRRIAAEHIMDCYVIWKFAENKDGAQQFLIDYMRQFPAAFRASEFYNFPCFPKAVPDLATLVTNDPKAVPRGKYAVLATAMEWSTNVGHPGYASAAVDQVYNQFVIPTMFARAARGDATPEDAVREADREAKRIFARYG